MRPSWVDINARVRGLGARLLTSVELDALAREPNVASLGDALRRRGLLMAGPEVEVRAADLELAVRRWAAGLLNILARWAGPRSAALPLVFDEEDRRSLRAICRGAAERAPVDRRLAGLIPTPALPERALAELAAQQSLSAVASLLSAWRHPFAEAFAPVASVVQPDLFAIEVALSRAFAARAIAAARSSGSGAVHKFVQETIDLENGVATLALAGTTRDVAGHAVFLDGGRCLAQARFEQLIATDAVAAGLGVAAALRTSSCGTIFAQAATEPGALEDNVLRCRLRALRAWIRRSPLDAMLPIWFALRLRAEVIDLQRIIWTVSLNAPREWLSSLITAAA